MKILVVEDNIDISEVMSTFCGARKDIVCQVTNTGQEGLDRIRAEHFDLILLDLAMPDFSGFDIVKSLKQDGLLESKNIVIFTASTDQRLFDEMKKAGIKDIFKKPFSINDLTALIDKYRPRTK